MMVFGTEWQAFNLELPAKNEHIKTKELFWLTLSKLTVLLQAQSHISTRYYRILEFSRILNAPNTGKVRRFSSKVLLESSPYSPLRNIIQRFKITFVLRFKKDSLSPHSSPNSSNEKVNEKSSDFLACFKDDIN